MDIMDRGLYGKGGFSLPLSLCVPGSSGGGGGCGGMRL